METTELDKWMNRLTDSWDSATLIKVTLSRGRDKKADLINVFGRRLSLKGKDVLSLVYRHTKKDITKNFSLPDACNELKLLLSRDFFNADLITSTESVALRTNFKLKASLIITATKAIPNISQDHDNKKINRLSPHSSQYLFALGLTNEQGVALKTGQKKLRQIEKYLEIIDNVISNHPLPDHPRIIDMGSGKGYLTFALFEFLHFYKGLNPSVTGIELRGELTTQCYTLAQQMQWKDLHFEPADIGLYPDKPVDMLIALHACDTATDMAIAYGIRNHASIIIVAPCCHKQIRKQISKTNLLDSILQHGILLERQAELLTDGIRALLLEAHGYKTKVFEFISTEHTGKNVMIVATKGTSNPSALNEVKRIKDLFGIKTHFLEEVLGGGR